jgi:outer membrane protein
MSRSRPTSRPTSRRFARPALAALATALVAAWPGFAAAQNLQELVEAARGYDATFRAAQASAQSAEFRAAQADALGKPSAALTASAGTSYTEASRAPSSVQASSLQAGVNGRYPLFNRSNEASISQARKSLDVAKADLATAEQDLIIRVSQAYFDVLTAENALGAVRANKAFITEQLASAKRNFEVGTATITDTREAQARFDLAAAQEIAAENDLRTKRIALDQIVGRAGVAPKPLVVPVELPGPTPADPEQWVSAADQSHPTVRRARLGFDVATLETEKARAAEKPTLDAVASVTGSNSRGGLDALSRSNGTSTVASVGVQFNWPLFTGGSTQNRIKETLALEDKARNDLEAARRGVALGTRQAFFGLQSGLAQVKALEAAEASSKLALESTQLGYRVGVRVNLDVLNAQSQLVTTQRDLAAARYNVLLATLRLKQASGQLGTADVESLTRLLAR